MGEVVATIKLMPDSPDIDIAKISRFYQKKSSTPKRLRKPKNTCFLIG